MKDQKINQNDEPAENTAIRLEPEHIDQILASPALEAAHISALLGNGAPNIDLLLYIAEHPMLVRLERDNRLPEALETTLVEAFFSAMPQLGLRAYGPLASLKARTRARLDAERRKYELTAKYVAKCVEKEDAALQLLRNYLETDPAPIFVSAMRTRWSDWVARAEDARDRGEGLEILQESPALIAALQAPGDASAAMVAEELAKLTAKLSEAVAGTGASDLILRRALRVGEPQAKLVAAAMATFGGRVDLVREILGVFLSGASHAPHYAVMAARLAPLTTRNTFAQYLVDIASQNPEEPEAKITAERTHTILSARSVLPLIGSPLPAVDVAQFPDTDEYALLRSIPPTVEAMWKMWDEITPVGNS